MSVVPEPGGHPFSQVQLPPSKLSNASGVGKYVVRVARMPEPCGSSGSVSASSSAR